MSIAAVRIMIWTKVTLLDRLWNFLFIDPLDYVSEHRKPTDTPVEFEMITETVERSDIRIEYDNDGMPLVSVYCSGAASSREVVVSIAKTPYNNLETLGPYSLYKVGFFCSCLASFSSVNDSW